MSRSLYLCPVESCASLIPIIGHASVERVDDPFSLLVTLLRLLSKARDILLGHLFGIVKAPGCFNAHHGARSPRDKSHPCMCEAVSARRAFCG